MDPDQLRRFLRKWTAPIVVLAMLGAAVAYAASLALTPLYEASGTVLLVSSTQQSTISGITPAEVTGTDAALLTQPPLLQQVVNDLKLHTTAGALAGKISVAARKGTLLIDVTVTDPSGQAAAVIANTLMRDFVAQVSEQNNAVVAANGKGLETEIKNVDDQLAAVNQQVSQAQSAKKDPGPLTQQAQSLDIQRSQLALERSDFRAKQFQNLDSVKVSAEATAPTAPSSPRKSLNAALGGGGGLLVGISFAILLQFLDQGLRDESDVRERLHLPVLAVVPRFGIDGNGKSSVRSRHDAAEAYRRLRTNMTFTAVEGDIHSIVVTSVRNAEGKSRTAANLARSFAASGQRVVLVDADMRRPSQHKMFKKVMQYGTSDILLDAANKRPRAAAGEETGFANLSVITAGRIPPNPSELLASKHTLAVLRRMEAEHDLVVIDTPPLGAVTDALSLAANATATILVVEAGASKARNVRECIATLESVGARVVGVVLNKARPRSTHGYYYNYRYESVPSDPDSDAESWQPLAEPVKHRATGKAPADAPRRRVAPATPSEVKGVPEAQPPAAAQPPPAAPPPPQAQGSDTPAPNGANGHSYAGWIPEPPSDAGDADPATAPDPARPSP